jgi:hypothetical protein
MTITDDRIRELVRARVNQSPNPPTAAEISRRAVATPLRSPIRSVAVAAVVTAVVAGGLVLLGRRDGGGAEQPGAAATPASGVEVGAYVLPTGLPDRFRMLAVHEHAGDPGRIDAAHSVYESAGGARIELVTGDRYEQRPAWPDSHPFAGGVANWSGPKRSPAGEWTDFEVEFDDGRLAAGSIRGVDAASIAGVLANVRPGVDESPPTLADPGFTLVASGEAGADDIVAEWSGYWGEPGGNLVADSLKVTVRRFRGPVDPDLRVGVWNDTAEVDGRTIYEAMLGRLPTWYLAADVEVEVEATGTIDSLRAIAGLRVVDETEFASAVSGIEAAADLAPVIGESVTFESGVVAWYIGAVDDPRGVCLTIDETRRCDLALISSSGYTEAGEIVFSDTQLLLGDRWFTTGLRFDRDGESFSPPIPTGAETTVLGDRTYYVIEHPAGAVTVNDSFGTPWMRPAR